MNKSESIKELASALAKAQGAMGAAIKDAANPFFKSKYSDLASVIEAIKKPLADNGLSFVQGTDFDDTSAVIVETMLMHSSGEWLSSRIKMTPAKPDPQGIGSCITYAKRYGLQALIGVPSDDDDGNAATGKAEHKSPATLESSKTIAASEFDRLSLEDQMKIRALALKVTPLFPDEQKAFDAYTLESAALDATHKAALWSLFDSKQRASIKKIGAAHV